MNAATPTSCLAACIALFATSPVYSFQSVVTGQPLVVTAPSDVFIECEESTDPSATGVATVQTTCIVVPDPTFSDAILPSGLCPQTFTIIRTWSAADVCGNSDSDEQTITVLDSTPPVLMCPPDGDPAGQASAVDNCDPSPNITFENTPGDLQRIWTAEDACQNSSSCTQLLLDFILREGYEDQ